MRNFQQFSIDQSTSIATIGSGTLLEDVTKRLHDAGGRAIAHGTCPQVGVGGHATIGGLGPMSRMWGSCLDHVVEVQVVLSDSSIITASSTQHADIFFALKGAAAGFGVITEFKFRTHPEPGQAVRCSYSWNGGSTSSKAETLKDWQKLISDPLLSRKFSSEVIISELGMFITGTYFGPQTEFDALMQGKFSQRDVRSNTIVFKDWLGLVDHWIEDAGLETVGGLRSAFYSKSLCFTPFDLIPSSGIDSLFRYLDTAEKGTTLWFLILDLAGGATNDIPMDATAYAHRDVLYFSQSYAVNIGHVSDTTRKFLYGINDVIVAAVPTVAANGAYAGYVDPKLLNGQCAYWRSNLPRLERIKSIVDPNDVFHNPQSVRPAGNIQKPVSTPTPVAEISKSDSEPRRKSWRSRFHLK